MVADARRAVTGVPVNGRPALPLACVIGDMDLIRPLGLAGIPCASVAAPGTPAMYSRFSKASLEWGNAWTSSEALVERLVAFGAAQPTPPVLFYQHDSDLLLVARNARRLQEVFRFVLADPELIEVLVDKARFQSMAEKLGLPVPRARRLDPASDTTANGLDLQFPVIVKPLVRRQSVWSALGSGRKAVRVDSPQELEQLWSRAAPAGVAIVVQEFVAGEESAIESYHVYVGATGRVAAAFTGRKLRTYPTQFGDSTALVTTDATDVATLGRQIVEQLKLRGVAKLDFKRDRDGRLRLLEINPRFTLWHHLGAMAGLNIPAQVYGDLTGVPQPVPASARTGVRWCRVWPDVKAARDHHVPFLRWMAWTFACEAKSTIAWDDPAPIVMAALGRMLRTPTRTPGYSRHVENCDPRISRRH
jgi:predicted ATP-grasp superfamily ATP-dependent carboligase